MRYTVRGKSHRDVARVLERAIRRAGVPVAYTEGFSPRPKLQYGLALSTGYESDGEYVDLYLDPGRTGVTEPPEVALALTACLPDGLDVVAAAEVDRSGPSLQDSVADRVWRSWSREPGVSRPCSSGWMSCWRPSGTRSRSSARGSRCARTCGPAHELRVVRAERGSDTLLPGGARHQTSQHPALRTARSTRSSDPRWCVGHTNGHDDAQERSEPLVLGEPAHSAQRYARHERTRE
ncbi:MAG: TIGR03936 family radical SAM-associated protein [Microthrixaceae bacterium]